jgi:hypothetical protein
MKKEEVGAFPADSSKKHGNDPFNYRIKSTDYGMDPVNMETLI